MKYSKYIQLKYIMFSFIIMALIGGGNTKSFAEEIIRINGSGSPLSMLKPLITAYERINPEVKIITEKPLGSSGAVKALIAGALDIVVSSKILTDKEMQYGLIKKEFGKTPLAIVTAKNIPLQDITSGELVNIYTGVSRKWPNGENIRLVLRPQEDIDVKILRGLSSEMNDAVRKAYSYPGMMLAITDWESNEAIARTPGAIGASGLCGVIGEKLPLKILSLNGVMPSVESMSTGRYPLAKDIRFVFKKNSAAAAMKFLQFVYSGKGRMIAREKGVFVTTGN